MKLPVIRSSRRMFLRAAGAATAATAIPFLPSLASPAEAQLTSYDRVLFIVWSHGVNPRLWQPSAPGTTDVGTNIKMTRLRDCTMGLYMDDYFAGLEDKMSVLTGVGQIGAWGHQTSVALTASERGEDNRYRITSVHPTSIDNVLAGSSAVYDTPPAVDVLRLNMGGNETHSYIDNDWVPAITADVAHARLFEGVDDAEPTGPSEAELRTRRRLRVVERSLEQYRTLRDSGRLSSEDRLILEGTMSRYAALQANLQARVDGFGMAPMVACAPTAVSGSDESEAKMRDHVALFTQAFACNATRIGYWKLRSSHADVDGAHQANSGANQRADGLYTSIMRQNCRWVAELLRSMDSVMEGNGKTLLENSLVVVTSDMSTSVIGEHPGVDAPFLLAGGLGGKIRMGELIDYRDYAARMANSHGHEWYAGPPHNELLISIMKSMGLDSSDWGGAGFGQYACVRDGTCTDSGDKAQRNYVRYYHGVHASRRGPGEELPYLRLG